MTYNTEYKEPFP